MNRYLTICIGLFILASYAMATTTLRDQDIPSEISIGGLKIQGAKTNTQIQSLQCTNGLGRCMVTSIDEGDVYISTGSLPGEYRNSRTGKGPF